MTASTEVNGLSKVNRQVYRRDAQGVISVLKQADIIANEAPLQIKLSWAEQGQSITKDLSITMRTPGNDCYLVLGLLLSLDVINSYADIASIDDSEMNVIEVSLVQGKAVNWQSLERHFVSQASCGICGQSQLKALALSHEPSDDLTQHWLSIDCVYQIPERLRAQQTLFEHSGGTHGAGFYQGNDLLLVAEDIGRHNAVDKIIGQLVTQEIDTQQSVLVLSGRISYELVQKAVCAKIPVIIAVGAPSSLAIATAKQFNITLIGFTKAQQCNVYHGDFRLYHS